MPKELDLVALRRELPSYGLVTGEVGTVVHVYDDGRAYEVEFVAADGTTIAVETLPAEDCAPLSGQQILHARRIAVV